MFPIPPAFRPYAVVLLALLVVSAMILVSAVMFTGHDLNDPTVQRLLEFAVTIATVLLAALGLSSQIHVVTNSINGRMTELVDTTASNAFQAGQAAPAGAPLPPAPSTLAPSNPVNPGPGV
jgi:hypothetical protein